MDGAAKEASGLLERNGKEIRCSVEGTNRVRALLGLKPLRSSEEGNGAVHANVEKKGNQVRCSVEETNRVRASLGLKPLKVSPESDGIVKANVEKKGDQVRCSIEETNRVRASLGLKPLKQDDARATGATKGPVKAPIERSDEKAAEMRERIEQSRKRRKLHARLAGKTLGEDDGGSLSAADWIASTRGTVDASLAKLQATATAKKKEKQLRDLTAGELAGTRVAHDLGTLRHGDVLVLKDQKLIDDETGELVDDDDELENVRTAAVERDKEVMRKKQRLKNRKGPKSARSGGNEFVDDQVELDDHEQPKVILEKYDRVLEEEGLVKKKRKLAGAVLGSGGQLVSTTKTPPANDLDGDAVMSNDDGERDAKTISVDNLIVEKAAKSRQAAISMSNQAQDFYSVEEYDTLTLEKKPKKAKKEKKEKKEKKAKKEKKKRTKEKQKLDQEEEDDDDDDAAPIIQTASKKKKGKKNKDNGSRDLDDHAGLFSNQISPSRIGVANISNNVESVAQLVKSNDEDPARDEDGDGGVVFSATSGFASTMQSRLEQRQSQRAEREKHRKKVETKDMGSKAMEIDEGDEGEASGTEQALNTATEDTEDDLGEGIAGTLRFLSRTGELGNGGGGPNNSAMVVGRAKDAKPVQDSGKGGFVLEYRDDAGRLLSTKEAYRQMAYAFHGREQKPGLKKQAKRLRDLQKAQKMNNLVDSKSMQRLKEQQSQSGSASMKL